MPLHGRKKVSNAVHKLTVKSNKNLKGVYLSGLSKIIGGTPSDTGRARNNWFLSVSSPSGKVTNKTSGTDSLRLPENVLGKKIYFTNNLPYIGVLEYGGFPSPVMQGTFNAKTKSFEVRSIDGFSKQAPSGWVRVALKKMQLKLRELNK